MTLTFSYYLFFSSYADHLDLHSFPTRRSSDLLDQVFELTAGKRVVGLNGVAANRFGHRVFADRKSTRLNSSHLGISYAVFCLKKKSIKQRQKDCVKR